MKQDWEKRVLRWGLCLGCLVLSASVLALTFCAVDAVCAARKAIPVEAMLEAVAAQAGAKTGNTKAEEVPSKQEKEPEFVWAALPDGKKYHSRPDCSRMKAPEKLSREDAEKMGLSPCRRCFDIK